MVIIVYANFSIYWDISIVFDVNVITVNDIR